MKLSIRLLFILSVLAFAFIGCAKSSDIENLQEQIDAMQSEKRESIGPQIESIRESIVSLEGTDTALQKYIKALENQITSLKNDEEEHSDEIEALQNAVRALQEKDKDLQEQINALKEYVDGLISDTEKWADATFSTIEQYNNALEIIADIQIQIEAINSQITTTAAVYDAVITSINDTIASMQQDIETLKKQMKDVLARVQSVSYIPKYSDGNTVMTYYTDSDIMAGSATFDFEIKPASAATEIASVWKANNGALSIKVVYNNIATRATSMDELAVIYVAAKDGCLTVTASGKALKDEFFEGLCPASARLCISDGNNDITSEYVQIVPEHRDFIVFKDDDFEAYWVKQYDRDGNGKLTEEEVLAVTEFAPGTYYSFKDLTGIERFNNLEYIYVAGYSLTSLDLSHNLKLEQVYVNNNQLQTINLAGLVNLKYLNCSNNNLSNLNVDDNVKLISLKCSGNKLNSLNLDNNVNLASLDCSDNELSVLQVTNNSVLKDLNVSSNTGLIVLGLGNNIALRTINASETGLTALDLSNLSALSTLNLNKCSGITSIDLAANTALGSLDLSSTSITSLDVSNNERLSSLDVSSTSITSLDVSNNKWLSSLDVSSTSITSLDVSGCTELRSLDVSNNTVLTTLNVNGCPISSLKISGSLECLIGQYVIVIGEKAVIFYAQSVVKVVSADQTSAAWGSAAPPEKTGSYDDGAANTDRIVSSSPAAKWCRKKKGRIKWYLPALYELAEIYRNKSTLNTTLAVNGCTQLGGRYWSSTQRTRYSSSPNPGYAYYFDFDSGSYCYEIDNSELLYVRAVRAL